MSSKHYVERPGDAPDYTELITLEAGGLRYSQRLGVPVYCALCPFKESADILEPEEVAMNDVTADWRIAFYCTGNGVILSGEKYVGRHLLEVLHERDQLASVRLMGPWSA